MPERTSAAGTPGEELAETLTTALDGRLAPADAALVRQLPGDAHDRQPVHTVYVSADRFTDEGSSTTRCRGASGSGTGIADNNARV